MGYDTRFSGSLQIIPEVEDAHGEYINAFGEMRRVQRDPDVLALRPDPLREAVGLPIGNQGDYYTGDGIGVTNNNRTPTGQPSLWCNWIVEHSELIWNEAEKSYRYVEWLEYLIEHFFKPWGYTLEGEIAWQGDDVEDRGTIFVKENNVEAVPAIISQPRPSWEKTC